MLLKDVVSMMDIYHIKCDSRFEVMSTGKTYILVLRDLAWCHLVVSPELHFDTHTAPSVSKTVFWVCSAVWSGGISHIFNRPED
jgi:hypothetical protein